MWLLHRRSCHGYRNPSRFLCVFLRYPEALLQQLGGGGGPHHARSKSIGFDVEGLSLNDNEGAARAGAGVGTGTGASGVGGGDQEGPKGDAGAASAAAAAVARGELIQALVDMVLRNSPGPPPAAKQCAAWVLRQLVPPPAMDASGGGEVREENITRSTPGGVGTGSSGLTRAQWQALDAAVAAAGEAVIRELDGPWGDAAAPLLCTEWAAVRRGLESPALQDDAVVSVLQEAAAAQVAGVGRGCKDGTGAKSGEGEEGGDDSTTAGVRLIDSARSLTLLTMLRGSLRTGAAPPPEVPRAPGVPHGGLGAGHLGDSEVAAAALGLPAPLPVDSLEELEIQEGSEVNLPQDSSTSGGGGGTDLSPPSPSLIPCRVAFEAGRERSVNLMVAGRSHGACISASMLLVETVAARLPEERYANVRASVGASGIVRAVAPLAGCSVAIDQSHRKWLHVRVRSPFACLAAVARSPPMHLIQRGSGKGGAAARRRLQDGHWTLAFLDEEACAAAKRMVDTRAAMLRDACTITLAPLTSRGAVGYT